MLQYMFRKGHRGGIICRRFLKRGGNATIVAGSKKIIRRRKLSD